MSKLMTNEYASLLGEVKERVRAAQYAAFRTVNKEWVVLFYMREFYIAYRDLPKVQPPVAQIGWTQNLIILQRCRDPLEREFYIRMTRKFGWSNNLSGGKGGKRND
ncbi:MAG: DUF1016 domain-containing protein [Deltaproteobacteria bacterium]|nr:DUF1016 domain-containing protein [Deltaproteobacteria bacterium]